MEKSVELGHIYILCLCLKFAEMNDKNIKNKTRDKTLSSGIIRAWPQSHITYLPDVIHFNEDKWGY